MTIFLENAPNLECDMQQSPEILNILSLAMISIAVEKQMVKSTRLGEFISPQKGTHCAENDW